jgi:hypothetical protein
LATRPSRGRRARFSFRAITRGWPFYYESAAVSDSEILLRTVPNSVGYYTPSLNNRVLNLNAFEPAIDDTDGISLFRQDFVSQQTLVERNNHANGVRVSRLKAKDCISLGLSLRSTPDPNQAPGHVIIPEMPFLKKPPATKLQKQKIRDLAQQLAQIASKNEIYTPPGLPDPVARPKI